MSHDPETRAEETGADPAVPPAVRGAFREGDRVSVNYRKLGDWFNARVRRVVGSADGGVEYDVRFSTSGMTEEGVRESEMKPAKALEKGEAVWADFSRGRGEFFRAKIEAVHESPVEPNNDVYDLIFDKDKRIPQGSEKQNDVHRKFVQAIEEAPAGRSRATRKGGKGKDKVKDKSKDKNQGNETGGYEGKEERDGGAKRGPPYTYTKRVHPKSAVRKVLAGGMCAEAFSNLVEDNGWGKSVGMVLGSAVLAEWEKDQQSIQKQIESLQRQNEALKKTKAKGGGHGGGGSCLDCLCLKMFEGCEKGAPGGDMKCEQPTAKYWKNRKARDEAGKDEAGTQLMEDQRDANIAEDTRAEESIRGVARFINSVKKGNTGNTPRVLMKTKETSTTCAEFHHHFHPWGHSTTADRGISVGMVLDTGSKGADPTYAARLWSSKDMRPKRESLASEGAKGLKDNACDTERLLPGVELPDGPLRSLRHAPGAAVWARDQSECGVRRSRTRRGCCKPNIRIHALHWEWKVPWRLDHAADANTRRVL